MKPTIEDLVAAYAAGKSIRYSTTTGFSELTSDKRGYPHGTPRYGFRHCSHKTEGKSLAFLTRSPLRQRHPRPPQTMKLPTPIPIPSIELSPETGTITNALDLAAWLRRNSPDWCHIEDQARCHQMSRIERLELLALTFGLALERSKQDAIERELRHIRPLFMVDPFATPLDEGFEICDATFVPPVSLMDLMLRSHEVHESHVAAHNQIMSRLDRAPGEALPESIKPKDPADLAPAIFIGIGLFFAIAAGVLGMTGHGLAAALCGVTSILSLVRASKYPA